MAEDAEGCRRMQEDGGGHRSMQEDGRRCIRMQKDAGGCRRTEKDGGWLEEMVSFRLHARGTGHKGTSSFHSLMKSNYSLKDMENSLTSRPNQERPVGRRKAIHKYAPCFPRHPSV